MVVVRSPRAEDLLRCWEQGARRPGFERGLMLLELIEGSEVAAALPIGARERRLLALHGTLFGDRLDVVATCPSCLTVLELDVPVSSLVTPEPPASPHALTVDGLTVVFRLPSSRDVIEVMRAGGDARALLLRCVEAVSRGGAAVEVRALPDDVSAQLDARMAELDPGGELALRLACASCAADCRFVLDVGDLVFRQLERWARGVFREIHALARAYGWTEREILALSPQRRRTYLELVEEGA